MSDGKHKSVTIVKEQLATSISMTDQGGGSKLIQTVYN
jgi:hypothetical protein